MDAAVSWLLSLSKGSNRGTKAGHTAIPLNNSNNDLYIGMCLAISNTESFRKYDEIAGIRQD